VFNRKELIKKEYNKIMDQRLPNILSLMNNNVHNDKYHHSSTDCAPYLEGSVHEMVNHSTENVGAALEYDETALLSKMFTKDNQ
jgi:hypothetical protein